MAKDYPVGFFRLKINGRHHRELPTVYDFDKEVHEKDKRCPDKIQTLATLALTDLLCMLNWGTQWTMVSYLKK